MKISRIIILLIIVTVIGTLFITNNYGMENKYITGRYSMLSITIKNTQNTYILSKPIKVNISIKNLTNKNILINNLCVVGLDLGFEIKKPSGAEAKIKRLVYTAPPTLDNFIKLDNKKPLELTVNIADYYELDEIGEYSVKAIYHPFNGIIEEAWTGTIESNTIEFFVE